MREWSHYQQAIFSAVSDTQDSLLIEAVAGSGKSTTILEACNRLPHGKTCLLAFNKSIQEELKRRVTTPNAQCLTLHAAGWAAWRTHLAWDAGDCRVDSGKTRRVMEEVLTKRERWRWGGQMARLVGYAKGAGIVPKDPPKDAPIWPGWEGLVPDTDDAWDALIDHYGLDPEECNLELTRWVLAESIARSREVVDYDDMLYLPVVAGVPFEKYDTVFLDEAQDVSGIQMEMVARMAAGTNGRIVGSGDSRAYIEGREGRVIAVGDRHQCQPPETLVRTPSCRIPISHLKNGDKVVSVDFSHSCFKASGEKVKVSSRNYLGQMVEIISEDRRSRYTANHRCVVQCKPLAKKLAVYLMRRGENFRIGSAQFSSLRTRLCTEYADDLWILSLHNLKSKAVLEEALVALRFGLSERTFTSQTADYSGKGLNQPFLDEFWANVPAHFDKALTVLSHYGRQLGFPWVSAKTPYGFCVRRPSEVQACNLMEGMLVLHDEEHVHYKKHQWKPIEVVRHYLYDGLVYSLEVEKYGTYIADGIATHNSIYGFRGAMSNSMDLIGKRFDCRELPLSITYRCPQAVVRHAQQWVPHLEHAPDAAEGLVDKAVEMWRLEDFRPGDVILCRVNRPIVAAAFSLIRAGVRCKVLGRDIGAGLVALVRKLQRGATDMSLVQLQDRLDEYRERQMRRLMAKQDERGVAALADKLDTLQVFLDEARPSDYSTDVLAKIEGMFAEGNRGGVVLGSVHKSKGLEWERVFVLDSELYMPSPWARQEWEREGERNLMYVAATRAKSELRYISSDDIRR